MGNKNTMATPMITKLFEFAYQQGASDLHLTSDRPAFIRKNGALIQITETSLEAASLQNALLTLLTAETLPQFHTHHSIDFAANIPLQTKTLRVRGHYFKNSQGITAIFRLINPQSLSLEDIRAPNITTDLLHQKSGLILVTGATGSGKSTTLSAMINHINRHQNRHIITIEDPIEYLYTSQNSLIEQRELGEHTPYFHTALKDALRADPDVIVIGELRDADSVNLALQAAETGHLVLSTLHTHSAPKTIDRLLSFFPLESNQLIRYQLAESLISAIAQQLITLGDERIAFFEIMVRNNAISNLIRENKISQIPSNIQTGSQFGMQTYEQHLEFLQKSGIISDLLAEMAQNLLNPDIYS